MEDLLVKFVNMPDILCQFWHKLDNGLCPEWHVAIVELLNFKSESTMID